MTRDVVEQNKATTAEKINTESEQAMDDTQRAVRNAIQTMQWPRVVTARLLVLLCYLFLLTGAGAGDPTEQLRSTVDKVLTIVRSSNPKSKTQVVDQRAQLIAAIYPRFDFQEMAKRSLGRHWARRSPEEQREFVGIFAALMGRAYADNIESYTGQNVVYTREKEDQNYAEVDTKLVADKRTARDRQLQTPQRRQGVESLRPDHRRHQRSQQLPDPNSIASLRDLPSPISFVR